MRYGDIETLLRDWIDDITDPAVNVIIENENGLPSNLTYHVPLVSVSRFGGADNTLTLDSANVDVEVYTSTYRTAQDLASWLHVRLRMDLPGLHVPPTTINRVDTITGPVHRDWQSTTVRRFGASYQIVAQTRLSVT